LFFNVRLGSSAAADIAAKAQSNTAAMLRLNTAIALLRGSIIFALLPFAHNLFNIKSAVVGPTSP
jgi:hypothetical protein